jgi:hypothetical protein
MTTKLGCKFIAATNTQRFEADSLADDPVSGESVSGSNSLLTGNLTGNFSNLGLFLRFSLLII